MRQLSGQDFENSLHGGSHGNFKKPRHELIITDVDAAFFQEACAPPQQGKRRNGVGSRDSRHGTRRTPPAMTAPTEPRFTAPSGLPDRSTTPSSPQHTPNTFSTLLPMSYSRST